MNVQSLHYKICLELYNSNTILNQYSFLSGPEPLTWTRMTEIFGQDNRDVLEIEFAKSGNKLEAVLRPDESPGRMTIFHAAIEHQALNCLAFLLDKCADKAHLSEPDGMGKTPLHYAVQVFRNENLLLPCLKRLNLPDTPSADSDEKKVSFFNQISKQDTKLYFSQSPFITKELVSRGSFVNSRDCLGESPLHSLVGQCQHKSPQQTHILFQCLDVLIANAETDIDAINNDGQTPLELIMGDVSYGTDSISECCRLLVENGAIASTDLRFQLEFHGKTTVRSPIKRKKRDGFSALLHFIIGRNERLMKMYFKKHSCRHMREWEAHFIGNKLFLFYLISNFSSEIIDCFFSYGGNACQTDENGKIALCMALENGNFKMVDIFISRMKKQKGVQHLTLNETSYTLIESVLLNLHKDIKPIGINYYKCLKRLLQDDVNIKVTHDILDIAERVGDLEAIELLSDIGVCFKCYHLLV